jgi:hypothetical protein
MIEFKRNKETGILEVWKNGKKSGEIATMGDKVGKDNGNRNRELKHKNRR